MIRFLEVEGIFRSMSLMGRRGDHMIHHIIFVFRIIGGDQDQGSGE
jgi:hypothetical protein